METEAVVAGQPSEWTLPSIETGSLLLQEVRIEADPLIVDQITYDSLTNTISFSGKGLASLTSSEFVKIEITLVTPLGETVFSQIVAVYPSEDPLSND